MDVAVQLKEGPVRQEFERGDLQATATLALRMYGADIRRFLGIRLRSVTQADEAYLMFAEEFWLQLPDFDWKTPIRVWMYTLARYAATKLTRRAFVRREIVRDDAYWREVEHIRSTVQTYRQPATKNRMRELRGELSDEDQTLLILRVTRDLSWNDVALVMGEAEVGASEAELERASGRMRVRFHAATEKLRKLALAAGLIEPESAQKDQNRHPRS